MAAITPTMFKVIRVADLGQEETLTNAAIAGGIDSGRQAAVCYLDGTTGRAVAALADTLAHTGGGTNTSAVLGVISTQARTSLAQESVTLLREADVFLGVGVLDGLDFGAPVFLSAAAAGGLVDTAPATVGNVVVQVGYVVPSYRESGVDKLLRISLSRYAEDGAFVEVSV